MKCPKCSYLGFETGDRCRNCGYDFSLLIDRPEAHGPALDIPLRPAGEAALPVSAWLDEIDRALGASAVREPVPADESRTGSPLSASTDALAPADPVSTRPPAAELPLPLFSGATADERDDPLIKLPAAPRPPLAVRRTPETAKLRAMSRPVRRTPREPELEFAPDSTPHASAAAGQSQRDRTSTPEASTAFARVAAVTLDHVLLFAIDLAVIYFTLRMAGLTMTDWYLLPPAPLAAFLLLVKVSYFCAFTAFGGQTIGKMAARIRVVTAEGGPLDGDRAVRRTALGLVSAITCGVGFVPALFGSERLALHDRVAGTRVVALRSTTRSL